MNDLYAAALEVQSFCDARDWNCCLIGGLAVVRWGEPRVTRDADFSLLVGLGDEERFVNELLGRFSSRIDDPVPFALEYRMVLAAASNGVSVDISLGASGLEAQVVGRSTPFEFLPNAVLKTCSAEDLVLLKAIAGRGRDWSDIEGVAVVQGDRLDWGYVEEMLEAISEVFDSESALVRIAEIRRIAENE